MMPRVELKPPPESVGAPLAAGADDWMSNACLNWAGESWTLYAAGYFEAARILVEHVRVKRRDQDSLIYPIVFLYRQYLELTLKNLLEWAASYVGEPIHSNFNHSLLSPWKALPGLCRLMDSETGQVALSNAARSEIDRLLSEFDALDRTSYAFRYPVDRRRKSLLPRHLTHINIRQFGQHMDRLKFLLEQLELAVDYFGEFYRGPAEY